MYRIGINIYEKRIVRQVAYLHEFISVVRSVVPYKLVDPFLQLNTYENQ